MTLAPPFPFAGEISALAAAMIWAATTSMYAKHGGIMSARGLNIFKNSVALVCFVGAAGFFGTIYPNTGKGWGALALSGFFGLTLGDTFLFASLKRIGAQAATAMQCLAPPLTAVLAIYALDEQMGNMETAGLCITSVAVLGAIATQRPAHDHQGVRTSWRTIIEGILFGLGSAFCNAISITAAREAMRDTGVIGGTLARLVPALFFLLLFARLKQEPSPFRAAVAHKRQGLSMVVASLLGTFIGLLLLTAGVKHAKAGVTSALSSSYPIWVIPLAKYGLKEHVPTSAIVCTIVAVLGICLMVLF